MGPQVGIIQMEFTHFHRLVQHPSVSRLEIGQAASMLDIGIRNIFNEQHDEFRKKARLFFEENVVPDHEMWEKQHHCPKELFTWAGSAGLLGVDTPVEHGGAGRDFLSSMIMLEEQFYSNCSGPGFQMHSDIVMQYIYKHGSNEQMERYLPGMGAGRIIGGLAMTEPNAGSDVQRIQTRAKQDGTDWILNGAKVFITNGHLLDLVIVAAVTEPTAKKAAHGTTLFLVDYGKEGFNKGRVLHKIGHIGAIL
ncbi:unnamed protein product [Owenia fusiformis]|uniref:Uncharacterized protein n=1 Tax=Owenia fusiformis TaxID=6347 RepID=A0A8J1U1G0_OWEFU|nr:unnamed protein product [Owenia fusiformis]